MKLSNVEKAIANQNGVSWTVVRDAVSDIIRKRKANANHYVSALGSHPAKGVEIAIQLLEGRKLTTVASVWVAHGETKLVKPARHLLESFGYDFV